MEDKTLKIGIRVVKWGGGIGDEKKRYKEKDGGFGEDFMGEGEFGEKISKHSRGGLFYVLKRRI